MKKLLFLLLLVANSVFAQRVEHGGLAGISLGFPMQDSKSFYTSGDNTLRYGHNLSGGGAIGYRFRFLPASKSFYDLDFAVGFQGTSTDRNYDYGDITQGGDDYTMRQNGKSFSEFIMPISATASWNYRLTDRFHVGFGVSPVLYVQPQAVFDIGVLAKIGYRFGNCFELGLSYRYGCLDVMKHFNDGPAKGRTGHLSDLMLSVYIPFVAK